MVATAPPAAAATHDGSHPSGRPGYSQEVRQAAVMPSAHDGGSSGGDWSSGQGAVRPAAATTTSAPGRSGNGSAGSVGHHGPGRVPPTTVAAPAPSASEVSPGAPQATGASTTRGKVPPATPTTSLQVEPAVMTAVPVQPVVVESAAQTVTSVPVRPSAPAVKAPPVRASVVRPAPETFPGAFGEPMVLARGAWQGLSLQAATDLKVPIGMLVGVALFLLGQALIDRRDPKVSGAPERGTDDTIGFE